MKVCYVTEVLKQGSIIKTVYPYYILDFRNTKSHLFHVYLGECAMIEIIVETHVC